MKFFIKIFAFIIDIKAFNTAIKSFVSDFKPSKKLINIAFITDIVYFGVKNKAIFKRNKIITFIVTRNLYFIYDIAINYFQKIYTLTEGFLIRFNFYTAEGVFFTNIFVRDFRE